MVVYYLYLETSLIRCYSNYYYPSRLVTSAACPGGFACAEKLYLYNFYKIGRELSVPHACAGIKKRVFLPDPSNICGGVIPGSGRKTCFAYQIKITRRNKLGYVSRRAYSSVTLYNNFTKITVKVLNKLLANQQVSITQSELEQLIKIPKVKFDLPLNDQTYPSFVGLVGRPKTRG